MDNLDWDPGDGHEGYGYGYGDATSDRAIRGYYDERATANGNGKTENGTVDIERIK